VGGSGAGVTATKEKEFGSGIVKKWKKSLGGKIMINGSLKYGGGRIYITREIFSPLGGERGENCRSDAPSNLKHIAEPQLAGKKKGRFWEARHQSYNADILSGGRVVARVGAVRGDPRAFPSRKAAHIRRRFNASGGPWGI